MRVTSCLLAATVAGCSPSTPPLEPKGRIVVALTIDWEGADLSSDAQDALEDLRDKLGNVPLTHFVSAAYFTKAQPDPAAAATIAGEVRAGDEVAVHLHAWRSLATASGIEPKISPSFFSGTDKVIALEDGDAGFDTDLDVYDTAQLRALLATSRRLLESTHLRVSRSFRAGGYLGTPKVLRAIADEGYAVDSSAIDGRELEAGAGDALSQRLQELWPNVTPGAQPYLLPIAGGQLVEMPIAAVTDYVTAADILQTLEAAHGSLQRDPRRDVFVVLGFHFETAFDFSGRLGEAIGVARTRPELADELCFVTVEQAVELARFTFPAR